MQLLCSLTSPYARKARVVVIEKGLEDQVEFLIRNPTAEPQGVIGTNPLGKIPALILHDGTVLYDSPVVCEYLDSLVPDPVLVPASGPARWSVLRLQALGDGILDATYNSVMESRRPAEQQSADAILRWRGAIDRGVRALNAEAGGWDEGLDLGRLTAACALGYLDFRMPQVEWRDAAPALAAWYEVIAKRPSLARTVPVG
ncbi:MAG: glutathione S-transferase N-terminal domain-containing protein [Caulobacteraceae bacterium]|nr:glutathione S-transferase N-terminal domain-containing protein [Caulobacteraceae bacterium]